MQREWGVCTGVPGRARTPTASAASVGHGDRWPVLRGHSPSRHVHPPPVSPSAPGRTGVLGPLLVLWRLRVFTFFPLFCNLLWVYLFFVRFAKREERVNSERLPFVVSW